MTSTFSLAVVATCCSINMLQTACPLLMPRLSQSEIAAVGTTIPLSDLSRPDLVRLWHSLPPPKLNSVGGFHRGSILPAGPLHPISRIITHRLFGPGEWQGKELSPRRRQGENIFLGRQRDSWNGIYGEFVNPAENYRRGPRGKSKPFRISIGKSCLDKRPCLVLDYSARDLHGPRASNYFPWSTMRDELRELRPGVLIGLGGMGATLGNLNSAIFTLEKGKK